MSTFGFLVYSGLEEMDLVGPWEVISVWGKQFDGPDNIITIAEAQSTVHCVKGLKIIPDFTFEAAPALDYFLVPGGQGSRKEVNNTVLIDYIRQKAKQCQVILSVCTGALLLEKSGCTEWEKSDDTLEFQRALKTIEAGHRIR